MTTRSSKRARRAALERMPSGETEPRDFAPAEPFAAIRPVEWFWVAGLYFLAVVVYGLLAGAQPIPLVTPDEYIYGQAARSVAHGDGLTILGESAGIRAGLYLYLIAPAWWLGSNADAYTMAKGIGTGMVCLTLLPVWWLTRQFTSRWVAFVPAVLIVAGTWMTTAASILTENLALPLATASLTCVVMALRRASAPWIWWAVGFALLATWSRAQMAVLLAGLLGALLLDIGLMRSAVERRERLRIARVPIVVLGGLTIFVAVVLVAGGGSTLGLYESVQRFSPSIGEVAKQIGRQWVALTVMTAVVPMALTVAAAATPAAWREDDGLRPLLVVGVAGVGVFVLQSAWFNAGVGAPHAIQRYVVYAAPLLFVVATVVAATRTVPLRTTVVAGGAIALLGFATPAVAKAIEERGVYGLWIRLDDSFGASAGVAVGVVGLLAVGASTVILWRLRAPATAYATGAVILLVLVIQSQAGWSWQVDLARAFRAQYPQLTWLDDHSHHGVSRVFGFGSSPLTDNILFFNDHLAETLTPTQRYVGPAPTGASCTWSIRSDGQMEIEPPCNARPRELWNNDPLLRLSFANGTQTAQRALVGQVFRLSGPPRIQAAIALPCNAPTLAITESGVEFAQPKPSDVVCNQSLDANTWLATPGALILRFHGGRDAHRVKVGQQVVDIPAGRMTTVRVPLPAGAGRTSVPIDWTSADGAPTITAITLESGGRTTAIAPTS